MTLQQRTRAFVALGQIFSDYVADKPGEYTNRLHEAATQATIQNQWFGKHEIHFAFSALASNLKPGELQAWLKAYPALQTERQPKRVGLIMAGNLPLVGFHDMLAVLLAGHFLVAKTSSKDAVLPRLVSDILCEIEPAFTERIQLTERLEQIEAVIATGSDNSARYFEHYFGKYPHIIRSNRHSLAILRGDETAEELQRLADDIFMYHGMGCRNVSKLFLPKGFDINRLFEAFDTYRHLRDHNKYRNNFDYQQAMLMMNKLPFLLNDFVILREALETSSPIGIVHYEWYTNLKAVHARIETETNQLQCIVAKRDMHPQAIAFGQSQQPRLWDYADNVDTLQFLAEL